MSETLGGSVGAPTRQRGEELVAFTAPKPRRHDSSEQTVEEIAAGFEAEIEREKASWLRIFGTTLPLRTEQELRNAQHVETPEIEEPK